MNLKEYEQEKFGIADIIRSAQAVDTKDDSLQSECRAAALGFRARQLREGPQFLRHAVNRRAINRCGGGPKAVPGLPTTRRSGAITS